MTAAGFGSGRSLGVEDFPRWTMAPFAILVLAIAVLPIVAPRSWEKRGFQALVVATCAVPVVAYLVMHARLEDLWNATASYASFVTTLGALYIASGGVQLLGDIEATPWTNVRMLLAGSFLASFVGTTGASMLLIRPLLRTNQQREHKAHLIPFFIMAVANAGGLLTPLGDPPLLVGYIGGVPFFWTLRLIPIWLLYVGGFALMFYWMDRRAYARETQAAIARDRSEVTPLAVRGKRNIALLAAVVPAALLPGGIREIAMVAICVASLALTPQEMRRANGFTFAPIVDVAIIFAGLFACLKPLEILLAGAAPWLPLQRSWQLFWASGLLSSVLDNAPTYTAFAALARGVSAPSAALVAGIAPLKLAAVSAGSVVMGATTYIGNGPNLMVKAIAEHERFPTPTFFRYAAFAIAVMAPAHFVVTVALVLLER
jgi:Na+/H+ antiporter NhaD/arsenite permease-like protein